MKSVILKKIDGIDMERLAANTKKLDVVGQENEKLGEAVNFAVDANGNLVCDMYIDKPERARMYRQRQIDLTQETLGPLKLLDDSLPPFEHIDEADCGVDTMDNEKIGSFEVLFRCEGGHEQAMTYKGFTREWVELNVGLLTGDPKCYMFPPDDSSSIGKCSHPKCGKKVSAEIKEIE